MLSQTGKVQLTFFVKFCRVAPLDNVCPSPPEVTLLGTNCTVFVLHRVQALWSPSLNCFAISSISRTCSTSVLPRDSVCWLSSVHQVLLAPGASSVQGKTRFMWFYNHRSHEIDALQLFMRKKNKWIAPRNPHSDVHNSPQPGNLKYWLPACRVQFQIHSLGHRLCWLVLRQPDTFGKGELSWEIVPTRLVCGQACGMFSWLMIYVGGLIPLWAASPQVLLSWIL